MKVRLGEGVFVRHVYDESVVWCPRTGGCTVLRNAQPILEEMKREWRNVDDIVRAVTAKFECCVDEVREGVEAVVGELASQRFVAVEVIGESRPLIVKTVTTVRRVCAGT